MTYMNFDNHDLLDYKSLNTFVNTYNSVTKVAILGTTLYKYIVINNDKLYLFDEFTCTYRIITRAEKYLNVMMRKLVLDSIERLNPEQRLSILEIAYDVRKMDYYTDILDDMWFHLEQHDIEFDAKDIYTHYRNGKVLDGVLYSRDPNSDFITKYHNFDFKPKRVYNDDTSSDMSAIELMKEDDEDEDDDEEAVETTDDELFDISRSICKSLNNVDRRKKRT